jgi:hypothetical protein
MERFVFSAPAAWQAGAPGQYAIGDTQLTVSELGPLPENLPGFIAGELSGAGGALEKVALASGWPAVAAEAADGDGRRLVLVLQLLDHGVVVRLAGPAASFAAARAEVIAALGGGTVVWGPPAFLSVAELLEGVHK